LSTKKPYISQSEDYIDLRSLTSNEVKEECTCIYLGTEMEPWIKCSNIIIKQEEGGVWTIGAHVVNATDEDHDPAWMFRFKAVGVSFEKIEWGFAHFHGWIATPEDEYDIYDLRIPKTDYNPLYNARFCDACMTTHVITQQLPKVRPELKLAGLYFSIAVPI